MFIYVLKSTHSRFRYKIGISQHPKQRVKTVTEPSRLIFTVPLFGAAYLERWLHSRYKHLNRPKKGNGGTEWFYFWLPIRPIFWMLLFFILQILAIISVILLI